MGSAITAVLLAMLAIIAVFIYTRMSKEGYGGPPGALRAIHHNELGYRGWADNPGDFEGSSASGMSGYVVRSA